MKRLFGAAFALALAATGLVMTASPSSAHTSECVGQGTATVGAGLSYPPVVVTSGFSLTLSVGGCVGASGSLANLTAGGTLTGSCGLSSGSGTLTDGNHSSPFTYQSAGTVLVVVVNGGLGGGGVANAVPLPVVSGTTVGNTCSTGTAQNFTVTGAVTLTGQ